MPLPVAQLGYIPNVNVPQQSVRFKQQNPWEQMAMQILGQAVSKGASNLMTQDMATQAQAEGMTNVGEAAPWWKKIATGPTMTADQYQAASTRKQQADLFKKGQDNEYAREQNRADLQLGLAALSDASAEERQRAQLAATASEGKLTRDQQKLLADAAHTFAVGENEANRAVEYARLGNTIGYQNQVLTDNRLDQVFKALPQMQQQLIASEALQKNAELEAQKNGQRPPPPPASLVQLRALVTQLTQMANSGASSMFKPSQTEATPPEVDTQTPPQKPPPPPTPPEDPSIIMSRILSQNSEKNSPSITGALSTAANNSDIMKTIAYLLSGGRPQ